MTSNKTKKRSQPVVKYQLAENPSELLDSAFDILFEETFSKYGDLTTDDN
jgi:hypothetical protein